MRWQIEPAAVSFLPDPEERFDLWEAGEALVNPVMESLWETAIRQTGFKPSFKMEYVDDCDEMVLTWNNGHETGKITGSLPSSEVYERVDVSLEINVRVADRLFVDGSYVAVDPETVSFIRLTVDVPESIPYENREWWSNLRTSMRGVVAHELQHAVQDQIYGWELGESEEFDHHMFNLCEIDARVEELLATYGKKDIQWDVKSFQARLVPFLVDYLTRNGVDSDHVDHSSHLEQMIESHTIRFRQKFLLYD